MNLVGVQLDMAWEDKPTNFAKVRQMLSTNPPAKGDLVVLPEMFATGFSTNVELTAEEPGAETETFLAQTAKELGIYLVGGFVARTEDGPQNVSVTYSPEGMEIARYAKIQPFTAGGESDCHHPGDRLVSYEWNSFTVTPFICYDLRFPEIFRPAAKRGTQLFTVIASWPVMRIEHWVKLLQARAIENQAYVVGVNRTGADPKYSHTGRSLIVDPQGNILADAGEGEGIITATPDKAALEAYREKLPFLDDIREAFVS